MLFTKKRGKMTRYIFIIILSIFGFPVFSQSPFSDLIDSVKVNNPELKLARENLSMLKTEFKTGITPSDPAVEYGYFPGNKPDIGIKEVFGVTQEFDFPVVYIHKKNIAELKGIPVF